MIPRFPSRSRLARTVVAALLAVTVAAPLTLLPGSAQAYWRGRVWVPDSPPVYVAPQPYSGGPYAYAPPPPQPYYAPPPRAYLAPSPVPAPAPVTYECNNSLVGGLIGAAAGGLIGSQIGRDSGNAGATIIGVIGGGILGAGLGSASCDD